LNQKDIGRRIKTIRQNKNITREELAKKLGVSYSSIEKHEQGLRGFKIETINRFAKALEVSTDEILYPTNEDKEKAVAEAQDILKQEFYDKPAAETLTFLLGQIDDNNLKNIYSEKLKNNSLDSNTIQLIIKELAKNLEYILYKLNKEK